MFIGKFGKDLQYPASYVDKQQGDIISDGLSSIYSGQQFNLYFFGTIYNKVELGCESDQDNANVAAVLFESKGDEAFSSIDGSFTVIIYFKNGDVVVARDHHGTDSQVYYNRDYFASSLNLLSRTKGFRAEPDYQALSSFLSFGYIPTPNSSFKNVHKLGAGEILMFSGHMLQTKPLFDTNNILPAGSLKTLDEYAEEYGCLHEKAIQRRIGNSRNVGILLSGGYDSGCNLAALRKNYDGDIRSYSVGFKGDNWTELPLARCMSDTFGTIHHEYEIDGSEILALPDIVEQLGDPFVEGGLMVNYAAMHMIGENKPDVILGGDGSDQYFGTSGREVALHYLLAKYGLKPIIAGINKLLNQSAFEKNTKAYRIRFHTDKILNILEGDLFGFPSFLLSDMLKDQSYMPDNNKLASDLRGFDYLYTQHAYKSDIEKIINQVILFKASRMASMFDNRIAFPYMDNTLYNFLAQLPVEYKCRGNSVKGIAKGHSTAKFLLKYHYKPLLPEAITAKKKQGGFAPMPIFFKAASRRERFADFILSSSVTSDYLKRDKVEAFLRIYDKEAAESGNWFWYKQNKAIQYFNLLTLAIWWERFVIKKNVVL